MGRQIRTTRSILNSALNDYRGRLDMSSLCTFLYEIMATINSWPLTYQCLNDPKSLEPLTPNHLLTIWRTRHFLHHHEISSRKKFTPENNGKRSSFWQNNFGVGAERSTSSTSIRDKKKLMVSAKEKSENWWHHNRSRRSSTKQVAPWQDHEIILQQINKASFVLWR